MLRGRSNDTPEIELREDFCTEGCTDYLALPLNYLGGAHQIVVWATDHASGFREVDIAMLEGIRPAIASVMELAMTMRTARGLFLTYHARHVGERIAGGQIKPGQVEPLRAAIMAIDLRNFTGLSDRLPGNRMIKLLGGYFEAVTSILEAHGGSVLKFMGDGVLAIFAVESEEDQIAARKALAAARELLLEFRAHAICGERLRVGIGLHIGTVMYGNVGSKDRLDFTVIGPDINLTFRLEALTKELGSPVLTSRAFADAAGELISLGTHAIRGLLGLKEVFGLAKLVSEPVRVPTSVLG